MALESLQPDTRYSILVTAEYRNREGGSGSAQGKTSESNTLKDTQLSNLTKFELMADLMLSDNTLAGLC